MNREKSAHTPGPWEWDAEGTRGYPILYGGADGGTAILGLDRYGERMYLTLGSPDARLIAAAPEMLEALKDCRAGIVNEHGWTAWRENFELADKAIAKAEGR